LATFPSADPVLASELDRRKALLSLERKPSVRCRSACRRRLLYAKLLSHER
jgi:hypothetical protein